MNVLNVIKPYYPTLEAKIAESGITKKYIANKLEITPRALSCKLKGKTYYNWLTKGNIPVSSLMVLADIFDCSIDYLLGRTRNPVLN